MNSGLDEPKRNQALVLEDLMVSDEQAITELKAQNARLRAVLRDAKRRIRNLERELEAIAERSVSAQLGLCDGCIEPEVGEVLVCELPAGHSGHHRDGDQTWGWVSMAEAARKVSA